MLNERFQLEYLLQGHNVGICSTTELNLGMFQMGMEGSTAKSSTS
jgi:hypothetical protein